MNLEKNNEIEKTIEKTCRFNHFGSFDILTGSIRKKLKIKNKLKKRLNKRNNKFLGKINEEDDHSIFNESKLILESK
ncbi:hypothetical protein NUSPORA_01411 [Nucleospora cyclopteri]